MFRCGWCVSDDENRQHSHHYVLVAGTPKIFFLFFFYILLLLFITHRCGQELVGELVRVGCHLALIPVRDKCLYQAPGGELAPLRQTSTLNAVVHAGIEPESSVPKPMS